MKKEKSMSAIDLIVLGMLKQEPFSAYDMQKQVEYRNVSRWVKISTPSIYKKVIQLEEKGLVESHTKKEGKMPEKTIYSITAKGAQEFERLMLAIAEEPIHIFLDFNAVIVNLQSLPEEQQRLCLEKIRKNVMDMKGELEENIRQKEHVPTIPAAGMAVLRQQYMLIQAVEAWLESL